MPDLDGRPDGFMVECQGPAGLFGVFKDDGETGYLYLWQAEPPAILNHHWSTIDGRISQQLKLLSK